MTSIFQTFNPKNSLLSKYIDYYYLDFKPDNKLMEFECFPHFNNTISIYKSHLLGTNGDVFAEENKSPLQIFTPIRHQVLNVKQHGSVHRVVIVLKPLAIYHFFKGRYFTELSADFDFFTELECRVLFQNRDIATITDLLDSYLESRFLHFENKILKQSLQILCDDDEQINIDELSQKLEISRRHLNRLFQQYLGVSVKKFQEIVAFRKTINRKLFHPEESNFTQLAYRFNYNDQSHLIKSYKNFTGNSPKQFFKNGQLLGTEDTFWRVVD